MAWDSFRGIACVLRNEASKLVHSLWKTRYIIYLSNKDTVHICRVHTRLRSCYCSCLSTRHNIRLQGYPFRHKEIYGHQTTDHKSIFIFLSFTFLSCTSLSFINVTLRFLLLFLPFICLDLYVSSRYYNCMYRLQLQQFNFTKILLAQIQRICWNS
jgi:hypothetical protein